MGYFSTHSLLEAQENKVAEEILIKTYNQHQKSGKPFNTVNGTQWQIDAMKSYANHFKNKSFGEGGRNMLRLIIDTIKAKKEATEDGIERGLTKEIDFLSGRQSAFRELLNMMERDLNLLEGK